MNRKPKSDKLESLRNGMFNHPDESERSRLQEIWDLCGSADVEKRIDFKNSMKSIDQALLEIEDRLDSANSGPDINQTGTGWNKKWFIAAALILIILGAGFLLLPKVYMVPYGEIAEIELPDGTHVELNSGTQLRHNRFFGITNRDISMNGEAYFSVRNHELPFILHANESIIEVIGTQFNVRSWYSDPGSETHVAVTQGEVYFYSARAPETRVNLTPGLMSSWNSTMASPEDPVPASVDRVLSWRENLLNFDEKPLSVILGELERRFDVKIDLEVPELQAETLTTFYTEQRDLEIVLKDICLVKGLRYAETANGYRIYR
jgi:transmembrane sensor